MNLELGRLRAWMVALAIAAYLALVVARAWTYEPFIDEAWYAMPAWNLAVNGSIGTPVIETSGSPMPGMDIRLTRIREHTYWIMPLPTVLQAAWFKVVGFNLLTTRLFTTLWAALLLYAWFSILRRLSGDTTLAVLGVLLTSTDQFFIIRTAFGRADMMSAALGFCAIELYLRYRERSLGRAVLFAQALVVAAGLSHPNGGILSFLGLLALILLLDRKRLAWRHAALAIVPYCIGAAAMAAYILQDPAAFSDQFFHNTGGRLSGLLNPFTLIPRELGRYLEAYSPSAETSLLGRTKLLVLAAYFLAAAVVLWKADLRKKYRVLLVLTAAYAGGLTIFENFKVQHYLIYVIPWFAALLAVAARDLWRIRPWLAAAVVAGLVILQTGSIVRLIRRDTYHTAYLPAIRFIEVHTGSDGLVMGAAPLVFGYGFRPNLLDDVRLGYLSGKRPTVVDMGSHYWDAVRSYRRTEPDTYRYITTYLATECTTGPPNSSHTLYVCHPDQ